MPEFYPAAQQIQSPDILGSYLRGRMAPLQIQAAQQEVTQGGLQIDQLRMAMKQQQMVQDYSKKLAIQATGAENQGASTGGIENGPQGSSQPGMQGGGSDGRVNTMMALDILQGRDPLKTMQGAQEYETKQRQLMAQGPLSLLDSIAGSVSPAKIVMNNPGLMSRWQQMAPQMGFDPVKDFTDDNVRQVVNFARNQVAGGAGLPTKEMPIQMQTQQGPLGSVIQTDPITHKSTQVRGEESLHQVIGPDGRPTLLPASQAAGRQPFNQSVFGASNLSDQSKEFAYQNFIATGKMPSNFGRNPAMQASLLDYIAKRAGEEGNSAASIAAKGQAFQASQGVVNDFMKGKSAQALNGINTAVQHMGVLDELIDAMGTGDIKAFNKMSNFFKEQTGQTAPTNYAALKEFVGGEVAKAVLPGGGGEAERQALTAPLNAANSPEQLKQAVNEIRKALAGKTEALRNQWDIGTNGTQGAFDKFLLPETKKALGISETQSQHPSDIQALLDKYK